MLMAPRFKTPQPALAIVAAFNPPELRGGCVALTLPTFHFTNDLLAIEVKSTFHESRR